MSVDDYYLKVAGVTFKNPDGSDRQLIIRNLNAGDRLYFIAEPDNPYDSKAVRIETEDGQQVGFVPQKYNSQIFDNLIYHRGEYTLTVSALTGGGFDTNYGLNFKVHFEPKGR